MNKKEIILQLGHSVFVPDDKLNKFVNKCGYNGIFEINARMDQRIINFLKNNSSECEDNRYIYEGLKEYGCSGYVYIEEVDTSRYWILNEYDGAEYVAYIDIIDSNLNLCKLI
nr:hypothetical protein [Clostridioides sp.]